MTWWAEGDWPEHGYWVKVVLLRDNPEGDSARREKRLRRYGDGSDNALGRRTSVAFPASLKSPTAAHSTL